MALLWSTSNVLPNVLRAAGDVNFTSYVSLITMWLIRSVIFIMRFHSDRWLNQRGCEKRIVPKKKKDQEFIMNARSFFLL